MKATLKGRIDSGMFVADSPPSLRNAYAAFDGKPVEITIGPITKKRSNPQNSYLWGVVYKLISDETGDDAESVHHAMRSMFLADTGRVVVKVKSTSKLTTVEFQQYVREIQRWAAGFLGLYIPDPNEEEMWWTGQN